MKKYYIIIKGDKKMDYIIYTLLGVLQGLTEPIPVSSSGHLFLFKNIFNTNIFDSLNFEIIANFGSFIAIFIIFYKDIKDLVIAFFSYLLKKETREENKNKFKYCWYIVLSTLPVVVSGLLFKDFLENDLMSLKFLSMLFIVTSIMLFVVRKIDGSKKDQDITLMDAIIIGLFQCVAILPGISRSGSVLVACLLCKLNKETALKYTFLLYFPVSVGSMILGASDLLSSNEASMIGPYLLGTVAAGIVTFFSYKWLSDIVKKGKLIYFSIYCMLLSIFIMIYFR